MPGVRFDTRPSSPPRRATPASPSAGATFDPAIRVSFTLTLEEWERYGAGQFVVRWYNSETGAWDPLATTVHPSTRTVSAAVPHFTLVAVFAVPVEEVPAAAATTTDPPTAPTLTFGAVATATAVKQAGLPLSWLTGLAALAGAALLIRKRG